MGWPGAWGGQGARASSAEAKRQEPVWPGNEELGDARGAREPECEKPGQPKSRGVKNRGGQGARGVSEMTKLGCPRGP